MNEPINPWQVNTKQKYDITYNNNVIATGISKEYADFIAENSKTEQFYIAAEEHISIKESDNKIPIFNVQYLEDNNRTMFHLSVDQENKIKLVFGGTQEKSKHPFGRYHKTVTKMMLSYQKLFNSSNPNKTIKFLSTYNKKIAIDTLQINEPHMISRYNGNTQTPWIPRNVGKLLIENDQGGFTLMFSTKNVEILSTKEILGETLRFKALCKQFLNEMKRRENQ